MSNEPRILRNGFEALTRDSIEYVSVLAMDNAENLRTICAAIARLQPEGEIHDLAKMGMSIADGLHNDLDVMRERAELAGVLGELVPEPSSTP